MSSRLPICRTLFTGALLGAVATAQVAVNDVFDRPDSSGLGADWIEVSAGAEIRGNRLVANTSLYGWALHSDFSAPLPQTVARMEWAMNGTPAGDSLSLILGASSQNGWHGIDVKICDHQGFDDKADRVLIYAAPNGGSWPGGGNVYNLATPMAAGSMTCWFSNAGDTLNIELRDATTGNVETTSVSGVLALPFGALGTGIGVGYLGDGSIDDLQAWTGLPTAPAFTLTTPRSALPASFLVTGASPNMPVEAFVSLSGAGPLPTPFGLMQLTPPLYPLASLATDGAGRAELPLAWMPPFPGVTLYLQAFDAGSLAFSNGFSATIQ